MLGLDVDPAAADRVRAAGAAFVEADVTDREALGAALDGADLVVHTAALRPRVGRDGGLRRVNVGGTAHVLDAAREAGADRVVHISSVVVYGYETPPSRTRTAFRRTYGIPYIDTKSASDRLACRRGAVVIRPGDVYGPGSVPWTLRPLELARAGSSPSRARRRPDAAPLHRRPGRGGRPRRWPRARPARRTRPGTSEPGDLRRVLQPARASSPAAARPRAAAAAAARAGRDGDGGAGRSCAASRPPSPPAR